jgi:t-SNARE complex subunit (syntaxin)
VFFFFFFFVVDAVGAMSQADLIHAKEDKPDATVMDATAIAVQPEVVVRKGNVSAAKSYQARALALRTLAYEVIKRFVCLFVCFVVIITLVYCRSYD